MHACSVLFVLPFNKTMAKIMLPITYFCALNANIIHNSNRHLYNSKKLLMKKWFNSIK